jgi:single-stranded DNA-specific DHH superfamily exonuclease
LAKASSALEQLRQLDEQRKEILESARKEALEVINAALGTLGEFGFNYRLVEAKPPAPSGRKGARQVKDAPCKVCGFKTSPPHDARAHRTQTKKKPFTDEELQAKGLTRV